MQEPLLTHAEVAALLGVSRRTVRRAWYRGDLPSPFYVGRKPYWPERELNAHIKSKFRSINNA